MSRAQEGTAVGAAVHILPLIPPMTAGGGGGASARASACGSPSTDSVTAVHPTRHTVPTPWPPGSRDDSCSPFPFPTALPTVPVSGEGKSRGDKPILLCSVSVVPYYCSLTCQRSALSVQSVPVQFSSAHPAPLMRWSRRSCPVACALLRCAVLSCATRYHATSAVALLCKYVFPTDAPAWSAPHWGARIEGWDTHRCCNREEERKPSCACLFRAGSLVGWRCCRTVTRLHLVHCTLRLLPTLVLNLPYAVHYRQYRCVSGQECVPV
jgi:hypothetical protein